jgi:uncharacterized protein (TIGR02145 family)
MFENEKKSKNSSKTDEDLLYEFVLNEMEFGSPRKGLLTKAVLESEGDDDKAKSLYLQYRVEGIQKDIERLQIDTKNIPKEKLFILIENDFTGYKKSSNLFKIFFYFFLIVLVLAVIYVIYLFIPRATFDLSSTTQKSKQNSDRKEITKKAQDKQVEKVNNAIRDQYGNTYKEIISPYTNRVWLDRNLGAVKVCESYDDEKCFGSYFQWGRATDGHEKPDAAVTDELSDQEIPDHQKFIIGSRETRYDWLKVQNNTLWQGHYGENNPCPQGFRLPTTGEYKVELIDNGGKNKHKIYKSFLKLPLAGFRNFDGVITNQGFDGRYWTSSRKSQFGLALSSSSNGSSPYLFFFERSNGNSVRCIKDIDLKKVNN